jgi:hypothetical protein
MTRMHRSLAAVAVGVVCLLPIAGCDRGSGDPSPTPTPTVRSSPPETGLERQQRLDFAAAEKSYRAFMAEYNRLARAGGANQATPVMKQNAAGPFLAFYVDALHEQERLGQRYTTGVEVGYVKTGTYAPEQLALEICEDGSKNKVIDKNGKVVSSGQILVRSAYAKPVEGRWKMWDGDEHGTASSCQS